MTLADVSPTELLRRALRQAQKVLPGGPSQIDPLDLPVMTMLARSLRLAAGMRELLQAQLPEEALFLGRSLFEDSLRLQDLGEAGARRYELLLSWAKCSAKELRGLAQVAAQVGLAEQENEFAAAADNEDTRLAGIASTKRLRARKLRTAYDSARVHGRLNAFWTYELAHEMVHGTDPSFMFSRHRDANDRHIIKLRTDDKAFALGVAVFGAEALLHAAIAVNAMFPVPAGGDLPAQLEALQRFNAQLAGATAVARGA